MPEPDLFKLEEGQVRTLDRFKRPYVVPPGTAWVGVRLAMESEEMNPAVKELEALSAGGIDYETRPEADYQKFPLNQDGYARVQFVAFSDPAKNPVLYELVFLRKIDGKDQKLSVGNQLWRAGDGLTVGSKTLQTPRDRAPNQTWEWAMLGGFALTGVVLTYVLFGRSLFERMLRVKRMEVSSALGASNLLVIGGFLLVLACVLGLFFFPKILWGKQAMIYLVVGGGALAALGAGYGAGVVMTKA